MASGSKRRRRQSRRNGRLGAVAPIGSKAGSSLVELLSWPLAPDCVSIKDRAPVRLRARSVLELMRSTVPRAKLLSVRVSIRERGHQNQLKDDAAGPWRFIFDAFIKGMADFAMPSERISPMFVSRALLACSWAGRQFVFLQERQSHQIHSLRHFDGAELFVVGGNQFVDDLRTQHSACSSTRNGQHRQKRSKRSQLLQQPLMPDRAYLRWRSVPDHA
jgi:hypothetical protein